MFGYNNRTQIRGALNMKQRGKLHDNGLFESSRMMLPEHKEEILRANKELLRRPRVVLDEMELENVSNAFRTSMELKRPAKIRLYDPFEELQVIGVVEKVDMVIARFKVDGEWFKVADVLGAELAQ